MNVGENGVLLSGERDKELELEEHYIIVKRFYY